MGEGIVEEELGELRYRTRLGEVNNPAKYFNALLQQRLETGRDPRPLMELDPSGRPLRKNGLAPLQDNRTYHNSCGQELFAELAPIKTQELGPATASTMQVPYSTRTIPWATFIGPEFFTLSTNNAKSDRVIAKFRVLGGRVTEVPVIRGRLFPKDQERGILTAEDGRILGAIECLWVEQGCQYAQFGNGSVSGHCSVPIRRLAQLLGWRSFGGRDLDHLRRKVINLKVKGYYLELDAVEELRRAGMKGYGFTLIDGVELVDKSSTEWSRRFCEYAFPILTVGNFWVAAWSAARRTCSRCGASWHLCSGSIWNRFCSAAGPKRNMRLSFRI